MICCGLAAHRSCSDLLGSGALEGLTFPRVFTTMVSSFSVFPACLIQDIFLLLNVKSLRSRDLSVVFSIPFSQITRMDEHFRDAVGGLCVG